MNSNFFLCFRLVMYILGLFANFIVGCVLLDGAEFNAFFDTKWIWLIGIGSIFLGPVIVSLVITIQKINPFVQKQILARPTHYSNPFGAGQTLSMFHFVSYFGFASGLGLVFAGLVSYDMVVFSVGAASIFAACGMLLGVVLCSKATNGGHRSFESKSDKTKVDITMVSGTDN